MKSESLPPVVSENARILILGTMPGNRSLALGQYYAHPRNAFWELMEELLGVEKSLATRKG